MKKKRIALISTGGTIEKTYDVYSQVLKNGVSVLDVMLAGLQLGGIEVIRVPLMNKDSAEMGDRDHKLIARTAGAMAEAHDGVVVVHGTDTLAKTGEYTYESLQELEVPIVLTGAMSPYEMRHSDAMQNLTEAFVAVQILDPGVYVVIHNKVLPLPSVVKDTQNMTFVKKK